MLKESHDYVSAIRHTPREPAQILVVEDDHDTRVLLRATLEQAGYVVETAANGRDAMARLQAMSAPPRLLLVDLLMPVMDGFELIAFVRESQRFSGVPIGVQSANVDLTLPGGVAFVLPKPVDIDALLAFVRHHVS
jgi:two-component system response regulator MprA